MSNLLKSTKWLLTLLVIVGLLAPPVGASAQQRMAPTYTFTVNNPGSGYDANPGDGVCETVEGVCSLRAAVDEANASEGADVIVFDPSITNITLTRQIVLEGEQGITIKGDRGVTLYWNGYPFPNEGVLEIWSDNNVIQGLTIAGSGMGMSCVKVTGDGNLLGVNINEATNHYLEQNTFMDCSGNGVYLFWGAHNQVTGNTIVNNGDNGILVYHADENIIGSYAGLLGYDYQMNHIYGNEEYGVEVISGVDNYIAGNFIGLEDDGNHRGGVYIRDAESLNNTLYSNVIREHNATGILIHAAQGTRIKANTIVSNTHGVFLGNGATQTLIGNDGTGTAENTRNVIAGNVTGIRITGGATAQTVIAGNYIGTDATGTLTQSNTNGIVIEYASNNRIGGPTALERNLISGNVETGISIESAAAQNVIINNYIGTDVTGALALPNQRNGITINGDNNRVGGATSTERNLISGNGQVGVAVGGDGNEIVGNYVGVDVTGDGSLGNGRAGIYVSGDDNSIGSVTGGGNRVAYNPDGGILVETGSGNAVRGNAVFDNGLLGLDLLPFGVTPNDPGDADPGSNALQNYPELSLVVSSGNTRILGSLNSTPATAFTLDFYASDNCDDSGHGEGQTYIGTASVTTNNQGDAGFYVTFPEVPVGRAIVATATDPDGNTSEFSQCSLAVASPPATGAYEVNSTADVVDDDTGDAACDTGNTVGSDPECTLRAAIQQANASPGADLIIVPAGTYTITITGNDNAAAMGDFDITDDVSLVGAGAATTFIDGGGVERVFHMDPSDAGIHVTLSGVTVQGGSSTGSGAGIYNRGVLTLTQSVVRYNQETLNGGGLYNGIYGVLRLVDSTIYSNTANNGAGLHTWGLVTTTNTTFSQNQAESSGGGIYVDYGQAWLYNVTLTENVADSDGDGGDGGGIVADSGVTVTVQNSILAGNDDNSHNDYPYGYPDCVGVFASGGYNFIADSANRTGCTGFANGAPLYDTVGGAYLGGGGLYFVYPVYLGPLQNNGGPTPTHMPNPPQLDTPTVVDRGNPLAPGSAITTCATTDQRGLPRPIDGDDDGTARCDKGAVEFFLPNLTINNSVITESMTAIFTVTLYPAAPFTVTVPYVTGDETALSGSDYVTTSGTLTFAPGETGHVIAVTTLSDALDEADETFTLALGDPENATLGGAVGACTLLDDDPLPTLSLNDISVTEGDSGSVNAIFTVTLSAASGREVQVGYATADGTATAAQDYIEAADGVIFAAGELTQTITVTVLGDAANEADETFTVTLSAPLNALIGDGEGIGTILNDDPLPLVSVDSVTVTEGQSGPTEAVFTVSLSEASGREVQVAYATVDGTATAGSDYTAISGTLTFAAGQASQPLTVTVSGDTLEEPDETFSLTLSSPVNAGLGTATGVGAIADDDVTPSLSINDVSVTEGDSGATQAVFTVSLSIPAQQGVQVDYATADDTATAGEDYVAITGTLDFPVGVTTLPLTVTVLGDTLGEADETFSVILSHPVNARIVPGAGDGEGVGTILNDDIIPTLSINNASVTEGSSGITTTLIFTVTLSEAIAQPVTVTYATSDGTATAGADYVAGSGVLTFAPGVTAQTIPVTLLGDTDDEANETFTLTLSAPVNATLADAAGVGTIVDDDGPVTEEFYIFLSLVLR